MIERLETCRAAARRDSRLRVLAARAASEVSHRRPIAEQLLPRPQLLRLAFAFSPPFAAGRSPRTTGGRAVPPPYGMQNYKAGNLYVAGEPNPSPTGFADMSPRSGRVPAGAAGRLRSARRFDRPVAFLRPDRRHELAHEFPRPESRTASRTLWLEGLFVNICLHAYVASVEPGQLPVLETLCRAFALLGGARRPALHPLNPRAQCCWRGGC